MLTMVEARSLDVEEAMRQVFEVLGDDPRVQQLAELKDRRRSQAEPPPLQLRAPDGEAS